MTRVPAVKPQPSAAYLAFRELDGELWLASRLKSHRVAVFDGITDRSTRMQRTRQLILDNGLAAVVLGNFQGVIDTYTSAFERVYGEPLAPKAPRSKHKKA